MGSTKIEEPPALRALSRGEMASIFAGGMFCDPLAELESLGGLEIDDEPKGGGSIRA